MNIRNKIAMSVSTAALTLAVMVPAALVSTEARAQTDIAFTLDWVAQGPHGIFFHAKDAGYYEEEGLNVTFDPSQGSGDAANRIAGGSHDMGFPDINSLIEFNAQNPDDAIQTVLMVYNSGPFSIFTMADSDIQEIGDLEGHTLGAPSFDASMRLFPAVAAELGIDMDTINIENMSPQLRETMLLRGDVDAITGHVWSSLLNIVQAGTPEEDVRYFLYGDIGIDFYANGVAVSSAFQQEHPEAIEGFVRATIRSVKDIVENPELAIDAVVAFEPLLDREIERARLDLALECCLLTETVQEVGFGAIDPDRLEETLGYVVTAFGLDRTPGVDEMYNPAYLPPAEERMLQ